MVRCTLRRSKISDGGPFGSPSEVPSGSGLADVGYSMPCGILGARADRVLSWYSPVRNQTNKLIHPRNDVESERHSFIEETSR